MVTEVMSVVNDCPLNQYIVDVHYSPHSSLANLLCELQQSTPFACI